DGLIALEAGDAVFLDTAAARHTILSLTLPPHPTAGDLAIIDTPLYVLAALENDYLARGDLAFSARYRDRIEDILRLFSSFQNAAGFVDARQVRSYGFFPDWSATPASGPDAHGAPAYGQMLLLRAFEIGADFFERWGDAAQAGLYRRKANQLRDSIRARFWDPQRRVFLNGIDSQGRLDTRVTRYAQTFAILTGVAPRSDWAGLVDGVLANPAYRPANWSIGQQWEFLAFARAGRMSPVIVRLKSDWGAARRRGWTRFIEDIRPGDDELRQLVMYSHPFGNSLCHAWAGAAVILALTRGLLGVWPTGPGYSTCRVAPQLCGLKYLRGSVPTPRGPIAVEVSAGRVHLSLPPGTRLEGSAHPGGSGAVTFDLPAAPAALD
ncbi:MAG: alpha-L-rhamnosidase C-terminal domain-containing protein, partial [Bryobacteraceae bacterium]